MPQIITCPACKKAKPESDFTLQKNGFRQKRCQTCAERQKRYYYKCKAEKIPHTERSKQISADARNFKTRLLAQIHMIRGKHGRDDVLLPSHAGIAQKGNKK